MSISVESGSLNPLYCELCNFIQFSSYTEFHTHHLTHVRRPLISLVKLNPNLYAKLQAKSYKVNTGVARRSFQLEHVPPLKISLVKQQGTNQFHVIKKERNSSGSNSPNLEDRFWDCDSKNNLWDESKPKGVSCGFSGVSKVEGKNLLERLGANISVSRKGKPPTQTLAKIKEETGDGNGKKDPDTTSPNVEVKKEHLLDRLSGISISTKSKSSTNGNSDSKPPSGISISSKLKSIDLSQLKKLKDQDSESDKVVFDKNKILEKLSGSGSISIAPKTQIKTSTDKEGEKSSTTEAKSKGEAAEVGSPRSDSRDALEKLGSGVTITGIRRSKSEDSNDGADLKSGGDSQVNASEENIGKVPNENSSENCEQKKFVRVKNSTFSKKNIRPEKQNSQEEPSEERTVPVEEPKEKEGELRETGIDILERLTENLNNAVGVEKAAEGENPDDSNQKTMEEPLLSTTSGSEGLNPDFTVSQAECSSPAVTTETHFNVGTEGNAPDPEQDCSLLLTPPRSSGQDGENSNYGTISSTHQPEYVESGSVPEENNEVRENTVSFSSLTNDEDQSQVPNEQPIEQAEQPIEQTSFWTDIRNASNSVDQPQQDPLMTPENPVPNGESINQNFLHNFLSEHQPPPNSIPAENSEFMSLDRLAQTQHQQPPYDLNSGDSNTPMEQLSQQVQRIPNPTPQINVISQHHMQAPQPPQLHSGVPLSPQHISPNNYDSLGHMQPPMPPPLYQGYTMFNQNYPPQSPPQMPRPPMLQQRPQIQARPFQSLAAPPRQRPRAVKRNMVRQPGPHDMGPPKQRRVDPPLQSRPQLQNPTAKIPSGITVTPPKKVVEASKVANVLASRGITVTPAASRQTNHSSRPQQRNGPSSQPTINLSSAVSITSSSQNRGSGGFAVPGPRRNVPLVNHNIERPERCATVDLTLDDDPPQVSRRGTLGRFPCNQCGKIFTSSVTLESHKASHRAAGALPFKCDKCSAQYTTSAHLQQHKLTFHKAKQSAPDLAIPIVDLNHPGAREQLLKCGVYNFLPLAQLQSNNNGYFGMPIIQLDTAKEKAVSNLSTLGAGNIFILGKMKALAPQPNH